ncbi:MarR family winged helix-turn-helix transcriptional regulator [Desnuesiella massiliensis]|uniref:MarR family winged helix-turn-helix transcriptional regulator n=1 Tax=Desnuesiella massiliensis TaxID=1650662 RepID=UPI0006E42F07|nr:MarR family transcriptional regulator [Desnuesiella massiliensis]
MSYGYLNDLNLKLLITLSRAMTEINKAQASVITQNGLTLGQFAVLEVLYHKGELCINDIIKKILSTSGNVTVVIENLVKEGYITKQKDPMDKRVSLINITMKGRELIEKIFPMHLKNLEEMFHVLTDEDKIKMIELSKKLGKSIGEKR